MTAGGAYDLSEDYESVFEEYSKEGDPRLLFANFTSSLLIVNSTLLAYAALALAALGALAYLFYYLTTQNSSSGGYGYGSSSSGYGYGEDEYGGYSRRFRRDTRDTEWIRILTLLDVGSQMYSDMTPANQDKKCPSKIICQAFESRDILGGSNSYLSIFYQFVNSMRFTGDENQDVDNYLTEETSSCRERYPDCDLSLISRFQETFEERRNAKLKFV